MAEPFSIVTGAVGLIALAAHVSTKLRTVFKSAAANNWVQKAQDHITIVIHHVEHLRNNVTRHHCAKQGSYYQAAVDNVGERCRKLLRKMEATLDGVLRTAKLSSKTWAKMLRAGKMILADPRLQKYEQELCSEGLYLEKASNDLVKHFFSPMGSQFIEAQQNNSLIEDAMANHISSMRRGSRTPCLKRFLGAITGIARFSTSALRRTTFFDLARATMKMMKADVLRGATQNERLMRINPASWYISDGRLVMPRSRRQPKPPRLTRLFTQDRVEQLLPAHTPHYTYYKILLDARSELDPFGRLLDALIFWLSNPYIDFWSAAQRSIPGARTMTTEQKVQAIIHLLSVRSTPYRGVGIMVTFIHHQPCFAASWKADLVAFTYVLSTTPFWMLDFTYRCIRVDIGPCDNRISVLEQQKHSLAFVPAEYGTLGLYEYLEDSHQTLENTAGVSACGRPAIGVASWHIHAIDATILYPGEDTIDDVFQSSSIAKPGRGLMAHYTFGAYQFALDIIPHYEPLVSRWHRPFADEDQPSWNDNSELSSWQSYSRASVLEGEMPQEGQHGDEQIIQCIESGVDNFIEKATISLLPDLAVLVKWHKPLIGGFVFQEFWHKWWMGPPYDINQVGRRRIKKRKPRPKSKRARSIR